MRGSHDGHRLQPRLEYQEACGHNTGQEMGGGWYQVSSIRYREACGHTGQEACAGGVMVIKLYWERGQMKISLWSFDKN